MNPEHSSIHEQLKTFEVAHIQMGQQFFSDGEVNRISTRALQALVPIADGSEFTHPFVIEWYKSIMPKLQVEGWNFHDAFSRTAILWNNSIYALEYGFRLPYDFWLHRRINGKKVKNEKSILSVLWIKDNTMISIAQVLWIPLEELWPLDINGRNQFESRKGDPAAMIYFWVHGWKEEYQKQKWNNREPRAAFHEAMKAFNMKHPSQRIETDIKNNIRVRAFYTYLKTLGEL